MGLKQCSKNIKYFANNYLTANSNSASVILLQCKGSPLPILKMHDPIEREIEFVPTKTPYDPRWMLAGRPNPGIL